MDRKEIESFLKQNYYKLTNPQLAKDLNLKMSTLRRICYELGLKRIQLEYFTQLQITFLKKHFQKKGDSELAEIFQQKWPKQKCWTKKHIEKKRNYLKLYRTKEEINKIHQRNVKAGKFKICPVKMWNKRGRTPEGEIHYWSQYKTGKKYPVIKHNGRFIHWARWAWEQKYGKVPKGMNVVFNDGNSYKREIQNLILVTDSELARINSQKSSKGLSDNYIAGILTHNNPAIREAIKKDSQLLEIKRKQLTLNRIIYEQQIS